MAGYLIASYNITNMEGYQSYIAAVGPTILAHSGEILVAGPGSEAIEGDTNAVTVVLKFPSKDPLQRTASPTRNRPPPGWAEAGPSPRGRT